MIISIMNSYLKLKPVASNNYLLKAIKLLKKELTSSLNKSTKLILSYKVNISVKISEVTSSLNISWNIFLILVVIFTFHPLYPLALLKWLLSSKFLFCTRGLEDVVHCTFSFYGEVFVEPESLPQLVKSLGSTWSSSIWFYPHLLCS